MAQTTEQASHRIYSVSPDPQRFSKSDWIKSYPTQIQPHTDPVFWLKPGWKLSCFEHEVGLETSWSSFQPEIACDPLLRCHFTRNVLADATEQFQVPMCTYIYTGAHGLADKHVETHNFQACGNPDGVLGTFVDYSLNP